MAQAYGLGFDAAGVAALDEPATRAAFDGWLEAGYHGAMGYLDGEGARLRRDTRLPHPGATHALVVAASYGGHSPSGAVARYARGDDYHVVLREKLRELHRWLEREVGHAVEARPYVDSGPLLERDLAQRAGLGWFGKNTMLITPGVGSFTFLGALVMALELEPSDPFEADRCGRCTRCLDACPTGALPAPRVLDANRCISYLTIEHREGIPEALREQLGSWLYGCDVCNDVCPWNVKFSREAAFTEFAPRELFQRDGDPQAARALARTVLGMGPETYADVLRGSAMKRAKRWMLQRNACVVLGNIGTTEDLVKLEEARTHEHPVVREHAAWAIRQITSRMTADHSTHPN